MNLRIPQHGASRRKWCTKTKRASACRAAAGFTLIEMMVTLIVAAILLTVAGPAFRDLILNNRLVAASNSIAGSLNAARAEAITQQFTVTVCSSANGTACGGTWSDGWVTFIDLDADGTVDADDTVLRWMQPAHAEVALRFVGASKVRYNSQGFALTNSAGDFVFCDSRGANYAKAVIVSATGRVSVATDTNSPPDGIVNGGGGANVTCS